VREVLLQIKQADTRIMAFVTTNTKPPYRSVLFQTLSISDLLLRILFMTKSRELSRLSFEKCPIHSILIKSINCEGQQLYQGHQLGQKEEKPRPQPMISKLNLDPYDASEAEVLHICGVRSAIDGNPEDAEKISRLVLESIYDRMWSDYQNAASN